MVTRGTRIGTLIGTHSAQSLSLRASSSSAQLLLSRRVVLCLPQSFALHNLALKADAPLPTAMNANLEDSSFYAMRRPNKSMFLPEVMEGHPVRTDFPLGQRVQALIDTPVEVPAEPVAEEDLLAIYTDLLYTPKHNLVAAPTTPPPPSVAIVLNNLVLRLSEANDTHRSQDDLPPDSVARMLRARSEASPLPQDEVGEILRWKDSEQLHHRVLAAVSALINSLVVPTSGEVPTAPLFVEGSSTGVKESSPTSGVPLGLLSHEEWQALLEASGEAGDSTAAELTLDLMRKSNTPILEEDLDLVLRKLASNGLVYECHAFVTRHNSTNVPTPFQRDQLVKARIRNKQLDEAIAYLFSLEDTKLAAPMRSYTRVINQLFKKRTTAARDYAWDLFAHMRYAAHPQPDVTMYAMMIRACAATQVTSGEPQRALDLMTEMLEADIEMDLDVYNSVILVCARSDKFLGVAFRLAKQMLDTHRDAHGESALRPDRYTFLALLEGAKRVGDLARTRWILTEILYGSHGVRVDTDIMHHVLHCYAAYEPPLRKENIKPATEPVQTSTSNSSDGATDHNDSTSNTPRSPGDVARLPGMRSWAHLPPQTAESVIAEAEVLFHRIVEDGSIPAPDPAKHPFANVLLNQARLINAFLSIYYAHGPFEFAMDRFWSLFKAHGAEMNAFSYLHALNRCAFPRKPEERSPCLQHAERIWKEWTEMMDDPVAMSKVMSLNARNIERTYSAMIRVYAGARKIDKALDVVRSFTKRYPPSGLHQHPRDSTQSNETQLKTKLEEAGRPLVRYKNRIDLIDDTIPPMLTFRDVELLHSRLVDKNDVKMIGFLTAVCESYMGALRRRRDAAMKKRY